MKPLLSVLMVLVLASAAPAAEAEKKAEVVPDLVYGHKDGMALTLDLIRPARPTGEAILLLQSGGWYSRWTDPQGWLRVGKPLLDRGTTLFIVRHGSAPRYTVPEAIEDVRRAVRFIRLKAKDYGVDPERLGVTGGSAGGHLSLMLGTTGDDGDPKAKDPVLRQPSRVAAVVAICPPTDLRGWVENPPPAIKAIPGLKPPLTFDPKKEANCSPLLKVTGKAAPTLLIHGDKDKLVPIEHSQKMLAALEKAGVPCKLVTIEGAGHGFTPQQNEKFSRPASQAWFEKYLAPRKKPQ
jgi:acetyl esterase/lipase